MKERTLSSRLAFDGKFIRVRIDKTISPDRIIREREIAERISGVAILPVLRNRRVLLVREYKHAIGRVSLGIPTGSIEENETPPHAAHRELFEETGYKARRLRRLFMTYGSGTVEHKVSYYLATNLYIPRKKHVPDITEKIRTQTVSLEEAVKMALDVRFLNSNFAILILKVAYERGIIKYN